MLSPEGIDTGPLITSTSNLSKQSPSVQEIRPLLLLRLRRWSLASQITLIPPIFRTWLFWTVT